MDKCSFTNQLNIIALVSIAICIASLVYLLSLLVQKRPLSSSSLLSNGLEEQEPLLDSSMDNGQFSLKKSVALSITFLSTVSLSCNVLMILLHSSPCLVWFDWIALDLIYTFYWILMYLSCSFGVASMGIWIVSGASQTMIGLTWVFRFYFELKSKSLYPTEIISFVAFILSSFALIFGLGAFHSKFEERSESQWKDIWRKISKLTPFLWPKGWYLQSLVIGCYILLLLGRVVNVMVPLAYKKIVDDLTVQSTTSLAALVLYTFFRFLQGGVGLLSSLQYFLWIPVGQYTTREVSVRMLEHLHSLSFQFHINRKTGEVLRVIDRGTASIGSLLSYLAFNILPVFVDIGVAVVFFVWIFDWSIACIVFVTMVLYIFFTIWITEWRTKFRREMNDKDQLSRGRAVDSLLNFETVKYFGNEDWEVEQYEESILEYQKADWKSSASLNLLNTAQNIVITLGLFAGLAICVKRVSEKTLTVGDFVSFVTYLLQLYQPLNWFGTYYRVIQQNFIDMEKMLDLLETNEAIQDDKDAKELRLESGTVSFDNVTFSYDNVKPVLQNVSFVIPSGKTVALVGPSGSGKSTLLRLLFRFYDLQSGSIQIDGQDIRLVTQKSLRKQIGVVPQDTVLFNESIGFNIHYGDLSASPMDIERVAKAAQIHSRIMSFPSGYQTKVGERGLRLSGGEKQRVAIARTLLKNPKIILFDEATSSLDNSTEAKIQEAFETLCQERTTLVIAHRLSTIVNADEIIVLQDGKIVQKGTHSTLLSHGSGLYYQMWMRQMDEESDKE